MVLRNVLIALGALALVAGLILAVVWFARPHGAAGAAAPVAPPEGMLVAARTLPGGTLLRPTDILWKNVQAGTVPPGSITRSPTTEAEFLGAVTRQDFAAGEPLTESALVKAGDRAFLSAVLFPGDRAVSIAVDAPQSVAGLVLPGDRVDLILTQSFGADSQDPGRKSVGETVLRNIRVIAIDQRLMMITKPGTDTKAGTTAAPIPGTITLEVSDLEAERVLVAVQLGKLQLVVRSLENSNAAQAAAQQMPAPVWAGDVSPALRMLGRQVATSGPAQQSPSQALPQAQWAPPAGSASRSSIEVMRGSKTETH